MKSNELTTEIKELNLTYLMLAQQMVLADKDMALFRLGISKDIAEILAVLTPGQILKLSNSSMMLCRIRFDDSLVFGMLANYSKEKTMAQSHAAILMAGQPAEEIA
jgi:flagellar transcriptional activator FlhD